MEVCTSYNSLSTPNLLLLPFNNQTNRTPCFQFPPNKVSHFPGFRVLICHAHSRRRSLLLRATFDETSSQSFSTKKIGEDDEKEINDVRFDTVSPVNLKSENVSEEEVKVDDDTLQPLKDFFNHLNVQLGIEDTPTIFLYGGGALLALWLLSAIVGAIDSIPVFPKLLEVVGLGYSVWFTTRYLLFKKNREELKSKIEELKQEVLGSGDK